MAEQTRVLAFSASKVSSSLDVDNELRAIRQALDGVAVVEHLPAARAEELVSDLSANPPLIVHFMGHGSPLGLELAYGRDDFRPADGQALRQMLAGRGVELVVLSSCYSAIQANEIAQSVAAVVGTSEALEDESSTMFSSAFYRALRRGATVGEAMRDGQDAVRLQHGSDQFQIAGDNTWSLMSAAPSGGAEPSKRSGGLVPKVVAAVAALVVILGAVALGVSLLGDDTSIEAGSESGAGDDGDSAGTASGLGNTARSGDDATKSEEADGGEPDGGTGLTPATGGNAATGDAEPTPPGADSRFADCVPNRVAVASTPETGVVQAADDGCPLLSNSMPVPNQIDEWTIELTGGQEVSYQVRSNLSFASFDVYAPDGTVVATKQNNGTFTGSFNAPTTGSYRIALTNPNDTRLEYSLRLWDITDAQTTAANVNAGSFSCIGGNIVPTLIPQTGVVQAADDGCPLLSNSMPVPNQIDEWTIELTGGQEVSYQVRSNLSFASFDVYAPDGTVVATKQNNGTFTGSFNAPTTGSYRIALTNPNDTRLEYSLRLWDITDAQTTAANVNAGSFSCIGGNIVPTLIPQTGVVQAADDGCPLLSNSMPVPNQIDEWTIELTGGQEVSYQVRSNLSFASFDVYAPDGTVVATKQNNGTFTGSFNAPTTGSYRIALTNPNDTRLDYSLQLFLVG